MKPTRYFLLILLLISLAKSSLAYVDPGTGSMIIGSIGPIMGLVLGAIGGFCLKRFINPIKKFFREHTIMASAIIIVIIALLIFLLILISK